MNVGVVFGGRSCEHNVSIITACQIMPCLDRHTVVPVYIDPDGVWYTGKHLTTVEAVRARRGAKRVCLHPSRPYLCRGGRRLQKLDVMLVCLHGKNGEDGQIAALCEAIRLPYTCCGIAASGVGMDKALTKLVCEGLGIDVVPYIVVPARERASVGELLAARGLGFPLVVKPVSLGSSIGIGVARDAASLEAALDVAFAYDTRAIVERFVSPRRELNCAAVRTPGGVETGEIEEPGGLDEILSFADKYLREGKLKGMDSPARRTPAETDPALASRLRAVVKRLYTALDAKGVVRFDFLLDTADDRLYLNECNTVPGSLAYYLFRMPARELVDKMLAVALSDAAAREALTYSYTAAVPTHAK